MIVSEWRFRRAGKGREIKVYLEPRDVAALEALGGGSAGYGAEQVIRGHLAGLRLRRLAECGKTQASDAGTSEV